MAELTLKERLRKAALTVDARQAVDASSARSPRR